MNTMKRDTPRKVQSVVRTRSRWRDRGAPVPVPIMFALMAITSETARRITRSPAHVRRTALTLALLLFAPLAFAETKWELLVAGADSPCGPLSPPPSLQRNSSASSG